MDVENSRQFSRISWHILIVKINMLVPYHVAIIIKPDHITAEWIVHREEIRYNFASLDIFLFDALLFVSYLITITGWIKAYV